LAGLWWKRADLSDVHKDCAHRGENRKRGSDVTLGDLLRLRLTWFAFSFFFFSTLVVGALQNYAPSLFRDLYGVSLATGTSALTAYLIGGAAGVATGGFFAGRDKGQEHLVAISFLASAVLALILALSLVPNWGLIGIMTAMGFGVGFSGPSRDMLVRKCAGARLGFWPRRGGAFHSHVLSRRLGERRQGTHHDAKFKVPSR
jgi:predicted MFS family arabinose efflux permease